jgi:hypothetical protein
MLVWQGKAKARQTATQQPDHQKVFTFPDFLFLRAGQELVVVGMNSDQGVGDADKVTPLLVRQTSFFFCRQNLATVQAKARLEFWNVLVLLGILSDGHGYGSTVHMRQAGRAMSELYILRVLLLRRAFYCTVQYGNRGLRLRKAYQIDEID